MEDILLAEEMMKWAINYPRDMLGVLDGNFLPRQKALAKLQRAQARSPLFLVTAGNITNR